MTRYLPIVGLVFIGLMLSWSQPGQANSTDSRMSCAQIKELDLSLLQDAPTQVVDSAIGLRTRETPICKVHAYVSPQIGVEVWLPITGWNGKLITTGNGGWAGQFNEDECAKHVERGYAPHYGHRP